MIFESYERTSIIREAANHRPFIDGVDEPSGFIQIGLRHHVPKEWFDQNANVIPDISDMGRSVAIGEERHLVKSIVESYAGPARKTNEVILDDVKDALVEMKRRGFWPTAIFAPIELSVKMHEWLDREREMPHIQYPKGPDSYFVMGDLVLQVFWSSKYTPLDRLIIYDKSFGNWIVKPDPSTRRYLRVTIKQAAKSKSSTSP